MKKGGKQPGAGRPPAPPRPPAMSWRPATFEQAEKFRLLGGAKWLRKQIDAAALYPENQKGAKNEP
jgi:hypothetical protein